MKATLFVVLLVLSLGAFAWAVDTKEIDKGELMRAHAPAPTTQGRNAPQTLRQSACL